MVSQLTQSGPHFIAQRGGHLERRFDHSHSSSKARGGMRGGGDAIVDLAPTIADENDTSATTIMQLAIP
jgi:hypothetical protein